PSDVFAARERRREQGRRLRVAAGEPEQRKLPTVGEKQHVLDHGLRQHSLVRNEPKRVNPVLERFDCSNRILWGTDLTGDELDAFVTGDGLRAPNQIAGFGVVEYDADTPSAELS